MRRRCLVHAASTLTPPPRGRVRRLHPSPTHPCWHNVVFAERRPRPSEMSLVVSKSVCACIGSDRAACAHRFCIDPVASHRGGVPCQPSRQSGSGHRRPRRPRRKSHSVSKMYSYTYRTNYRRAETRGEAALASYASPRIEVRSKRYILSHPRLHQPRRAGHSASTARCS